MSEVTVASLTYGAIERFVLLAKSSNSARAISMVIDQAISSLDVLAFSELLELQSVQQLKGSTEEKSLRLLEIFAYGTYADYAANAATLAVLKPEQSLKLRLLTIVSLGSKNKTLSYDGLMASLHVQSLRELEDVLIEGIYRKIFVGKMDQKNAQFTMDSGVGRDLKPGELEKMTQLFVDWADNCQGIIDDMDKEMKAADFAKAFDLQAEERIVKEIDEMKSALKVSAASEAKEPKHAEQSFSSNEFNEEHMRSARAAKRY
eukprot:m.28270 g.28270  ORF g.28270 m.28270 type:complete len:261 (-) comp15892_c0_seq1:58-840(-)